MSQSSELLEGVVDLFKELVWDSLVKTAISRLFELVPLLGWGPIGVVATELLTRFANTLYEQVKTYIDLQAIAVKNLSLQTAFDDASVQLKVVAKDYGILSTQFEEARSAQRKRLSDLVSFDVVRNS